MNPASAIETPHPAGANERHSGIEALRLVSMFLILSLHVNFYAFGCPSPTAFDMCFSASLTRVFCESFAIVGVNTFVLISGWFGIRPKAKGVLSLLFQCAFFCCAIYAAGWVDGMFFSRRDALKNLFFLGKTNWFIKSYLALYILAPVLESFAASAGKHLFGTVVFSFFVFQTFYGWLYPTADYFAHGYSVVSFFGLYLLARYIRLWKPQFASKGPTFDMIAYAVFSAFSALLCILSVFGILPNRIRVFAYCSPFVVLSSLFLFLCFSKLSGTSRFVNEVARSSYAIYLFLTHPCVLRPLLIPAVAWLCPPHQAHPARHWVDCWPLPSCFSALPLLQSC